jgi:transcriptional regulator of heat shock response
MDTDLDISVKHTLLTCDSELMDDVSVIKTKYNYNGEEGTIAIIGPKRMEYERVVNLLNYIKENINELNDK